MVRVVRIVTHHKRPVEAAKAWEKEGVCAVGFVYDEGTANSPYETIKGLMRKHGWLEKSIPTDASSFTRFRDQIQKGDIVFAYVKDNTVGLIGVVTGYAFFNSKNAVGSKSGFNYPNQRRVRWLEKPRYFDRHDLPPGLSEWVKLRGTLYVTETELEKLVEALASVGPGDSPNAYRLYEQLSYAQPRITGSPKIASSKPSPPRTRRGSRSKHSESGYAMATKEDMRIIERRHAQLVNDFKEWLEKQGFKKIILERNWVDLTFHDGSIRYMAEAKIIYHETSVSAAIRMALGQVLDYNYIDEWESFDHWIILLDKSPPRRYCELITKLSTEHGMPLNLCWQSKRGFKFLFSLPREHREI